jgi:transketolase
MNPAGKVRPTVLALSRQAMPNLPGTSREGAAKGGYIVHGGDEKPDVIIMSTGAAPWPVCLQLLVMKVWQAGPDKKRIR